MLWNKNATFTQFRDKKIQLTRLQHDALSVLACATLNHLRVCARHAVKTNPNPSAHILQKAAWKNAGMHRWNLAFGGYPAQKPGCTWHTPW